MQGLRDAGLFRMWLPAAIGGAALDPRSAMRVVEAVARADGSVGWCVHVAAQASWALPALDEDVVAGIFTRDDVLAGSIGPGRAVAVDGGYRATGRFPFASGCTHATWLAGVCEIRDGDRPRALPDGRPERRSLFFRPADCEILDTWDTTGLRGTGSHDFAVADVFVPAALATGPLTGAPGRRWGGPLYRAHFPWPLRGAQALGIARHALDALIELAATKRPFGASQPLRDLPRVQATVARAEAALGAARAYLDATVAEMWDAVRQDRDLTAELAVRRQLATAHARTPAWRSSRPPTVSGAERPSTPPARWSAASATSTP